MFYSISELSFNRLFYALTCKNSVYHVRVAGVYTIMLLFDCYFWIKTIHCGCGSEKVDHNNNSQRPSTTMKTLNWLLLACLLSSSIVIDGRSIDSLHLLLHHINRHHFVIRCVFFYRFIVSNFDRRLNGTWSKWLLIGVAEMRIGWWQKQQPTQLNLTKAAPFLDEWLWAFFG